MSGSMARVFDPFHDKAIGEGSGTRFSRSTRNRHNLGGAITLRVLSCSGLLHVYLHAPRGRSSERAQLNQRRQAVVAYYVSMMKQPSARHAQMLEELGYEVVTATSGQEAATLSGKRRSVRCRRGGSNHARTHREQLTRELRLMRPHLPVILCSGFSSTLTEERIQALGLLDYLKKPFSKEELGERFHPLFMQIRKSDYYDTYSGDRRQAVCEFSSQVSEEKATWSTSSRRRGGSPSCSQLLSIWSSRYLYAHKGGHRNDPELRRPFPWASRFAISRGGRERLNRRSRKLSSSGRHNILAKTLTPQDL